MLAVMFAMALLLGGGFIVTQGGKCVAAAVAGVGAVIILIKVFA